MSDTRTRCWLCSSEDWFPKYRYEGNAIVRCRKCGFMWLDPMPTPQMLHEIYGQDYFLNSEFLTNENASIYGYADYIAERINKQYGYKKIVHGVKQRLKETHPGQVPTWLDVGCGFAYLIDVAFDEGFNVHGVEFNPHAVNYIRSKYTYDVRCGSVLDIDFGKQFDVISMFDVIEHLLEPQATLEKLHSIVAEDGFLLLTTMDSDSLVSRLIGKNLEDFRRTREHVCFFSRKTISDILDRSGWRVEAIDSFGHTFQLNFLLQRIAMSWPWAAGLVKACIHPRWLLDANFYLDPKTKMQVRARPK